MRVTFDLTDKDLSYFRDSMKRVRDTAEELSESAVVLRALGMIDGVRKSDAPQFVQERIEQLGSLCDMVGDEDWKLPDKERRDVLAALSYFAESEDLIPDSVPVLGFIDDAIMIELVLTELRHELDAFNDFRKYRAGDRARHRGDHLSREDYLAIKRRELHSRMRRRRAAARSSRSSRPRFRLF